MTTCVRLNDLPLIGYNDDVTGKIRGMEYKFGLLCHYSKKGVRNIGFFNRQGTPV